MKVVRVLKWIALVVCVAAFALNLVANGFITADVLNVAKATGSEDVCSFDRFIPKENELRMTDIKAQLSDLSFGFNNLKGLLKPYADFAEVKDEPVPVAPDETVPENEPQVTEVPALINVPDEIVETPVVEDEPQVTTDDQGVASSGSMSYNVYDVKDHCNLVFGLMKYGSASAEFGWLTKPLGLENVSVNISFFVGLVAMFIAIVTRVISKHYKTFYGTLLMILGLLIFFCMILFGVFASEKTLALLVSFDTVDSALVQFCVVAFCGILGALIGLPIYSCGIRQMTCKRLRRRLRRKAK